MKETILLTKILFKSSITQLNNKNKKNTSIGKILLYLFIYLYIAGFVSYISYETISSLILIKQEAVFLNICFIAVLFFCIIQSVITSLNILYFSKDLEILLPLPISPKKIVMAKLNSLILSQYILVAIILLPALIVYTYLLKLNIFFLILGLLTTLLFPIVPVVLIAFITTFVMRFTNIIKNKDIVQYLTISITILLIIVGQLFFAGGNNQITNQELTEKVVEVNGLIQVYSKYFITLTPTMNSLINYNNLKGIINLLVLFIESAIAYYLGSIIISKLYIETATTILSSGLKKGKKLKNKAFVKQSTLITYVKKEFTLLIRNPIFFMQCVLPSILFPFIISLPIFISLKNMENDEINLLQNALSQIINMPIALLGLIILITFLFMFNFSTVTCISRDGQNNTFMKYIPVKLSNQILYKVLPGIILNILPICYVIITVKIFFPTIYLKTIFYITIITMLINILNNYLMILVDLNNPKLNWITEYAVVKQNFNMFYGILLVITEIGVIIALGIFISNTDLIAITLILIFLLLNMLINKYINKHSLNLFKKIY